MKMLTPISLGRKRNWRAHIAGTLPPPHGILPNVALKCGKPRRPLAVCNILSFAADFPPSLSSGGTAGRRSMGSEPAQRRCLACKFRG